MSGDIMVPLILAIVAGLFGWWNSRTNKLGSRENLLIDQLQEDREKDRQRLDILADKIDRLERELRKVMNRDAIWAIHVDRQDAEILKLGGTPIPRPKELDDDL